MSKTLKYKATVRLATFWVPAILNANGHEVACGLGYGTEAEAWERGLPTIKREVERRANIGGKTIEWEGER